jgi:hypothetical protein
MKCNRQQGGSCRDCECRLPETGWLPCPDEAQGVLAPVDPPPLFIGATTVVEWEVTPQAQVRSPALSGDMCHSCGNFAMVRTGTCLTCQACGDASGGCS